MGAPTKYFQMFPKKIGKLTSSGSSHSPDAMPATVTAAWNSSVIRAQRTDFARSSGCASYNARTHSSEFGPVVSGELSTPRRGKIPRAVPTVVRSSG